MELLQIGDHGVDLRLTAPDRRLVKKLSGWLGYRVLRLPGIHRRGRLFGFAMWLHVRPWSRAEQRAWLYVLRTPGLLAELMDAD